MKVPVVPLEPEGDYASPREVQPVRVRIADVANTAHPEEACGFILNDGTVVVCDNIAPEPWNGFLIDEDEAQRWWATGGVVACWHSHTDAPAVPSNEDQSMAVGGIDTWIYSVPDEDLGIYRLEDGALRLIRMEGPE